MKLLSIALGLALASAATANPGWKRVNYTKSTIFNATVTFDGEPAEPGDCVGVFVNNECRMIAQVKFEGETSYVSSVVHTETSEPTKIMLYRASDGKTYEADSSFTTIAHGQILGFPIRVKSAVASPAPRIASTDGLVVYPSPFQDKLTISTESPIADIELVAADGTSVATEPAKGATFVSLNGISAPDGQYTVKVKLTNGEILRSKVVKQ